jgi:acetylornithine deacetylase
MRLTCPAVKMGPGESSRSHQADEFVLIDELRAGIEGYEKMIMRYEV